MTMLYMPGYNPQCSNEPTGTVLSFGLSMHSSAQLPVTFRSAVVAPCETNARRKSCMLTSGAHLLVYVPANSTDVKLL